MPKPAACHLRLDKFKARIARAKLPRVIGASQLLTASKRAACKLPNWPLAFEGRLESPAAIGSLAKASKSKREANQG